MALKRKRSKGSSILSEPERDATSISVVTLDSLPSEVLECILERFDSVNSLKTWRLVSKSWNEVCCRILRKVSAAPLNMENGGDLEKFKELILDRHAYFPLDWPNPFQNYKILKAAFVTELLLRFVHRPNVKVTTLGITHSRDFDQKRFEGILERHKGELTHLEINGYYDSARFLTLTPKLVGGDWRSLKSLTLTDTCEASSEPCHHVAFIRALTKNLKLVEIRLHGELTNIARVFGNNYDCWEKLTHLELRSESPPSNMSPERINELMKWTAEIQFASLTGLIIWFNDNPYQTSELYVPHISRLIQNYSHAAKLLLVSFLPLSLIPSLPKLEHMCCAMMDGDGVQDVTELKFPSLTIVYFIIWWREIPICAALKDSETNKKIQTLKTSWDEDVPTAVTQELLWCIIGKHFPNLNRILVQPDISSSTLHLIRKHLPKLQDIQLYSMTSAELLGTRFVHDFQAQGWSCQYFENSALLEMAELTVLTLGEDVVVSRSVISACLGRLPKIRFLRFYWNNCLEISDVLEHLGHIHNLKIVYKSEIQQRELEKLTEILKSLTLIKHED